MAQLIALKKFMRPKVHVGFTTGWRPLLLDSSPIQQFVSGCTTFCWINLAKMVSHRLSNLYEILKLSLKLFLFWRWNSGIFGKSRYGIGRWGNRCILWMSSWCRSCQNDGRFQTSRGWETKLQVLEKYRH